jgi:uncharacterized protein
LTRFGFGTCWLAVALVWSSGLSAAASASAQAPTLDRFYASANAALERGDTIQAFQDFTAAAQGGHRQAQFELASLHYFDHWRGDEHEAVRWFRQAAEQGHPRAQYMLGGFYLDGSGVVQNFTEGLRLMRGAAESGDELAQQELALRYYQGKDVPRNYREAAKWACAIADLDDAWGQHILGQMYAQGQGVPQDYVLAHVWLNLAASNSLYMRQYQEQAIDYRNRVASWMTPEQIAEAQRKAREWRPGTGRYPCRP